MLFVFGLIRTCKALPNFAQRCGHLRGQSALLSENRKPPAYRATFLPIRWAQVETALTFLFITV
jgi:hypothetical protein